MRGEGIFSLSQCSLRFARAIAAIDAKLAPLGTVVGDEEFLDRPQMRSLQFVQARDSRAVDGRDGNTDRSSRQYHRDLAPELPRTSQSRERGATIPDSNPSDPELRPNWKSMQPDAT